MLFRLFLKGIAKLAISNVIFRNIELFQRFLYIPEEKIIGSKLIQTRPASVTLRKVPAADQPGEKRHFMITVLVKFRYLIVSHGYSSRSFSTIFRNLETARFFAT